MGSESPPRKADIICFGDSLTVGFQAPTADMPEYQETPYGQFLQNQLGENYSVVVSGLCGELTGEMVKRFVRDVLERVPQYVIILGGTNDLGWNLPPSEIFNNLALMYQQAEAVGIVPIAVTVPSLRPMQPIDSRWTGELELTNAPELHSIRSHIENRLALNRKILDYGASQNIACIDLFFETAESDSQLLALPYSNDGLHLSTKGYELLSNLLWERIFNARV